MEEPGALGLFRGYGIELEYMIVRREDLSILPAADRVLAAEAGEITSEVEAGELCWSNELALHALELKTNGPASSLSGLGAVFQQHVGRVNDILDPLGARLMPTAMHPWMDPSRETRLWPHEYGEVYRAFDRIFGCSAHGWANLQSLHLNLPFSGDGEFGRLHAAVRLVLPLVPALAAASPVMDGRITGLLDNRLEVYRLNQRAIPSITGRIVPRAVFTRREYERRILEPIYRDIAAHDPEGVMRHEWLNSRGAIARFERNTVEIRLADMQECPAADLAVAGAIAAAVRAQVAETWIPLREQKRWRAEPLRTLLLAAVRSGEEALIDDPAFLRAFGFPGESATAGDLWRHIAEASGVEEGKAVETLLGQGTLSRRILRALKGDTRREALAAVYGRLCECLARGEMFPG